MIDEWAVQQPVSGPLSFLSIVMQNIELPFFVEKLADDILYLHWGM